MPAATQPVWTGFQQVIARLTQRGGADVPGQIHLVREFYEPILEQRYDNAGPRKRDLEQIEQLAKLPPREHLLAMLAGALQAPMAALAGVLEAKLQEMVGLLEALQEKREGTDA